MREDKIMVQIQEKIRKANIRSKIFISIISNGLKLHYRCHIFYFNLPVFEKESKPNVTFKFSNLETLWNFSGNNILFWMLGRFVYV